MCDKRPNFLFKNYQPLITEKSVQEILETAKVEEVIQDYVTLKRRGVNMIGLCPFHNEKTPSFTVSPSKNIYKCFGCGKGGNAVQFLMEHENMTFPEALRHLAAKFNIEIEETETSAEALEERHYFESLYLVNQYARDFFQDQLFNTDNGKSIGLSYFKQRGFTEETIRKFGLGFAPRGKDIFTKVAIKAGYQEEVLKKLGLTSQYGSDFFRDRVMFTVHNLSGKVIGFGGRTLMKDKKIPKYINSPETEIYVKNKVLYGSYFAKRAIRQQDECILVEGYTDVISLHQAGFENVVASSGTSLTEGQIRLVKRYAQNIKILYDGDVAGIKAALRGLDLILEQDLNVKVVLLPEGEDPDSYLQKVGVDAFKEYITNEAQDFILLKTNLLLEEAANDPIKKSALIKDIVGSIARIPDPLKRAVYIKECSRVVEVSEQILVNETNKIVGQRLKKRRDKADAPFPRRETPSPPRDPSFPSQEPFFPTEEPPFPMEESFSESGPIADQKPKSESSGGDTFQEKDIARILITGGDKVFDAEEGISVGEFILSNIEDVLDDFDHPLYKKVVDESLQALANKGAISSNFFLNHSDQAVAKLAVDCMSSPYEYSENWAEKFEIFLQTQKMPDENFQSDSLNGLLRFKLRKIDRRRAANLESIKECVANGEDEKLLVFLKVEQKLQEIRKELAAQLGTVVLK